MDRDAPAESIADTDYATAGSPPRRLVSTADRQLAVPGDFETIQAAVDQLPLVMRHKWDITIAPGVYDEDVIIPPFFGEWARPGQDERVPVQITGDREQPSNVSIGSLFATTVLGTIPVQFRGLQINRATPYDDEQTGIGIYGCSEVGLVDLTFGAGVNGIHSYNSQIMLRNVDFGENVLDGNAVTVKHGGFAYENIDDDEPTSGTVGATAYNALSGRIWVAGDRSTLTGESAVSKRGGMVWNYDNQSAYDPENTPVSTQRIEQRSIRSDAELVELSTEQDETLSRIDGGQRGETVTLVCDGEVTVSHGRDNIRLADGEDLTLSAKEPLRLAHDGSEWLQIT